MNFFDWKHFKLNRGKTLSQIEQVANFEMNNPYTAKEYESRLKKEDKKIKEIMSICDRKERIKMIATNLSLFI